MFKKCVVLFLALISFSSEAQVWEVLKEGPGYRVANLEGKTYAVQGRPAGQVSSFHILTEDNMWTRVDLPAGAGTHTPIFFDEINGIITSIFGETDNDRNMYRTRDGGLTWESYEPIVKSPHGSFEAQVIKRVDENTVIGRAGKTLYMSFDRGQTWGIKTLPEGHDDLNAIQTFGLSKWYFSHHDELNGGIYHSTNQGDSWSKVFDIPVENFKMLTPQVGYALQDFYAAGRLEIDAYKTTDGWETYETFTLNLPRPDWINTLYASEDNGFGYFVDHEFYYTNNIYETQPEVVQILPDVFITEIFNLGGEWFLRSSRAIVKLNPDLEATKVVITSIEEDQEALSLIYPNPASDYLRISNTEYNQFIIYDISGNVVQEGTMPNSFIRLKHRVPGHYVVRLSDSNMIVAPKNVKFKIQ